MPPFSVSRSGTGPKGPTSASVGVPEGASTLNLLKALDMSDRFRRDGPIMGIFHLGQVSFRELSPRDSLHIIIDGDRVSAHVDDVCPLRCIPGGAVGFSWALVLAHNLAGLAADIGRRIRGIHGQQRCNLGCEMVWVDDDDNIDIAGLSADLRGGGSSASGGCSEDRG